MPTLAKLKTTWFIPIDATTPLGVPCRRHTDPPGTYGISVSTDGNQVLSLIDGKLFMKAWHDEVVRLQGVPNAELLLAGWRFEGVETLGASSAIAGDAFEVVDEAGENGVDIHILLSQHITCLHLYQFASNYMLVHGVPLVLDNRYPAAGSNHFKYSVMKQGTSAAVAVVGSIDISKTRWDDAGHLAVNADRNILGEPTHDTGVFVRGPAVADLEITFRERWNDPSSLLLSDIDTPVSAPPAAGTCSIQVLRTYGRAKNLAYTWSPRGEYTVWAAYLNAISNAKTYIYIEDQYFLPFGWPPAFATTTDGVRQRTDLIFQLGKAMQTGVKIFVLTPSNAEDWGKGQSKYQRDVGINYLKGLKKADGAPVDFLVAALHNGTEDVYVHSKLMIIDDEVVMIGSANFSQRSMTCDGELQLAIVDEAEVFAKQLRIDLWREHLSNPAINLDNPSTAFDTVMKPAVAARTGHLKPYPYDQEALFPEFGGSTKPFVTHARWMESVFDPYYGPLDIVGRTE